MPTILNYDSSADLDIILNEDHSFNIKWYKTLNGAPSNWTGTHKVSISKDTKGDNLYLSLSVAYGGLSMVADLITWDITVILNTLEAGTYYYDWRSDLAGYSTLITKGTLIVNSTIAKV